MLKKKTLMVLCIVLAMTCVTGSAFASVSIYPDLDDTQKQAKSSPEEDLLRVSAAKANNACIMQGNTLDESDCAEIYTALGTGGYTTANITNYGWTRLTGGATYLNTYRVTPTEYTWGTRYTFSYYSGHGGKGTGYPVLNLNTGNSSTQSGIFTQFNVATTMGVSGSNWRDTAILRAGQYYSRVHVLAACDQLDSSIMKYYARIMRASDLRAIAGYHETAPAGQTDAYIADDFLYEALTGESVWSSWKTANNTNGNQPWAVLLYREYSNMYYRIPGFPGNTYSTPSSTAGIFRYASHLQNTTIYQAVTLDSRKASGYASMSTATDEVDAAKLPLYVNVAENKEVDERVAKLGIESRETIDSDYDVSMDKGLTDKMMREALNPKEVGIVLFAATPEIRTEVDPDEGAVEGSDVTVSWDQRYYNTYEGVRVNNAYLYFNVDAEGIVHVSSIWKDVFPVLGEEYDTSTYLTEKEARECAAKAGYNVENANATLIYEPTEKEGLNKLCYEFDTRDGRVRIDVETGEPFNMR